MRVKLPVYTAIGLMLAFQEGAASKPLDRRAFDLLRLAKAVQTPGGSQRLSAADLHALWEASKIDSPDERMAAAYLLAFTDAPAGTDALKTMQMDHDATVAAVAKFSVLRKEASRLRPRQRLAVLSFHLGQSDHSWTRTLLACRLGDEFKESAVPLFLAAMKTDRDPLVRKELLFQITCYGDAAHLGMLKSLLDKEPPHAIGFFHESESTFLDAVSINPSKRPATPLQLYLESRIRAAR